MRILVLDTPDGDLKPLLEAFKAATEKGDQVEGVNSTDLMLEKLTSGLPWDLAVLDYILGDGQTTGEQMLINIRKLRPFTVVIIKS